jgi:hypothetical protein
MTRQAWRSRYAKKRRDVKSPSGMTAYVGRVRFDVIDFSNRKLSRSFIKSRKEMEAILISKKIPRAKAETAVIQTLNIAANHCLEPLRRAGNLDELRRATSRLSTLIKRIESFVQLVSELPPRSKGKLNDIITEQDLRNFDWEVFANIIHAIIDELSRTSPAIVADRARLALSDAGFQAPNDPALARIRSAPPKILELWETIPAQARAQVEADVRGLSSRKSAVQFFRYLVTALKRSYPRPRLGRPPVVERLFAQSVAAIWRRLGLHAGRAYFAGNKYQSPCHKPSSFQRFCDLALAAVGDKSRVSGRQVLNLKSKIVAQRS